MSTIVIYHNPRCSKSRQTLQLLRERNIEPKIIEYLDNPPTSKEISHILQLLGLRPRQLMRTGEAVYQEHNLGDEHLNDEKLIQALSDYPILIERPIVIVDNKKAALGRPPENILEIL